MIVAAVPVRSLRDAKRRLEVDDRSGIAARMLAHVLDVLQASGCFDRVAVVSPDEAVLAMATRRGMLGLPQRSRGLNEACDEAARWARDCGANALLLVHGDLPVLTADSVRALVSVAPRRWPSVVLGPDRHGSGTNLLMATPPDAIPFAFGVNSRFRHRALARKARVTVVEYVSEATASDIDTAQDLVESLAHPRTVPLECPA